MKSYFYLVSLQNQRKNVTAVIIILPKWSQGFSIFVLIETDKASESIQPLPYYYKSDLCHNYLFKPLRYVVDAIFVINMTWEKDVKIKQQYYKSDCFNLF